MTKTTKIQRGIYIDQETYNMLLNYIKENYPTPWGHQSEVVCQAIREYIQKHTQKKTKKPKQTT
ncbi:MAG: hypothetical protein QXH20_02450 [Candidatus Bathyarchaeia archaeon]